MKKIIVVGIIILMLGVNIGSTFAGEIDVKTMSSVGFDGNTLYVGGSGPGNYSKIKDAIYNSSDGDIIYVYSGIYNETGLHINKSISIIGEDRDTTIIDGRGSGNIFFFECDRINICGFTIEDGGWSAIHMEGDSHNNISRNKFQRMEQYGIFGNRDKYNTVNNNIIENNIFTSCSHGILLHGNNNIVRNNTLTSNSVGIEIRAGGNFIIGNKIISSSYGAIISGNNNLVSWNNVSNNNFGFFLNSGGNIITHNNFIENEITLYLFGSNCNISYNNFIGSEVYHVKFTIQTELLFFIEFCLNFIRQIHIWNRNYWDDLGLLQIKTIKGDNELLILPGTYFSLTISIPTKDYDFSPASEPYDIG